MIQNRLNFIPFTSEKYFYPTWRSSADSEVDFFEGNFTDYEEWRRKSLGEEATRPHRITYRKLTRKRALVS